MSPAKAQAMTMSPTITDTKDAIVIFKLTAGRDRTILTRERLRCVSCLSNCGEVPDQQSYELIFRIHLKRELIDKLC